MEYTKKLNSIIIHTFGSSGAITVSDTVSDNKATRALAEFKEYGTMHILGDEKDYIPFHAVHYIELFEANDTATKPDVYGCD